VRRVRKKDGRGGRGLGRGGGGSGGGGGSKMNTRLVNASIMSAVCPEDILAVVRDNLLVFNNVNVSTAFNKLGKMGSQPDFSPRHLTADKGFQELLGLACGFAKNRQFGRVELVNTTHGIAKLHEAGRLDAADGSVEDALAALGTDTVRMAPKMNQQSVADVMLAYATLQRTPNDRTWAALEIAAERVAPEMNPQAVANTIWAYATLARMPDDKTWAALETAAGRVAPAMNLQAVANTMWAFSKLNAKQAKLSYTKKSDLLTLLGLPTMDRLNLQKRRRRVSQALRALRRADSDLSKVEVKQSAKPWTKHMWVDWATLTSSTSKA
jgi:hypothetical protein